MLQAPTHIHDLVSLADGDDGVHGVYWGGGFLY
jgi:hypothetical protein